jgi:hypothetical protein
MAGRGVNDDVTFADWQGYYRDDEGKRATLGILVRGGEVIMVTAGDDRLRFTPLETGLLINGLAAALRAVVPGR